MRAVVVVIIFIITTNVLPSLFTLKTSRVWNVQIGSHGCDIHTRIPLRKAPQLLFLSEFFMNAALTSESFPRCQKKR